MLEPCRRLRSKAATRELPVVIYSCAVQAKIVIAWIFCEEILTGGEESSGKCVALSNNTK